MQYMSTEFGVDISSHFSLTAQTDRHTCRPVDGTSMNKECVAVMVDRQVCAVRFLT